MTRRKNRAANRVLTAENLEERQLFAVTPFPVTDMTQMASLFGSQHEKTVYLNFDGRNAAGGEPAVSRFSGSRQDIHDILFRTSEIFAPFDVQVQRAHGNGNQGTRNVGNSTIFIGDTDSGGSSSAWTPWSSSDWPGRNTGGFNKIPDSNADDIAFVDPVFTTWWGGSVTQDNRWIAEAVAHEAGHTFGLVHVNTSPSTDAMSYDAANRAFLNQSFSITDDNSSPTGIYSEPGMQVWNNWQVSPWYPSLLIPTQVATQNSYTYLQTRLGSRSIADDLSNVADTTTVDPSYRDPWSPTVSTSTSFFSTINRAGDYDVFEFHAPYTGGIQIDVINQGEFAAAVDPVLLVYDSSGQQLIDFDDDGGYYRNSRLNLDFRAGETFQIVVGSYSAQGAGWYKLQTSQKYVMFGSFVSTTSANVSSEFSAPTSIGEALNPLISQEPSEGIAEFSQVRQRALMRTSSETMELADIRRSQDSHNRWIEAIDGLCADDHLSDWIHDLVLA